MYFNRNYAVLIELQTYDGRTHGWTDTRRQQVVKYRAFQCRAVKKNYRILSQIAHRATLCYLLGLGRVGSTPPPPYIYF